MGLNKTFVNRKRQVIKSIGILSCVSSRASESHLIQYKLEGEGVLSFRSSGSHKFKYMEVFNHLNIFEDVRSINHSSASIVSVGSLEELSSELVELL